MIVTVAVVTFPLGSEHLTTVSWPPVRAAAPSCTHRTCEIASDGGVCLNLERPARFDHCHAADSARRCPVDIVADPDTHIAGTVRPSGGQSTVLVDLTCEREPQATLRRNHDVQGDESFAIGLHERVRLPVRQVGPADNLPRSLMPSAPLDSPPDVPRS